MRSVQTMPLRKGILLLLFFALVGMCGTTPASHLHSQHHHLGEREEDGGFSPRDSHHYDDDGEHHSEFDHEAILGSVKDAEEFDQLEPEEAKKRLRILLLKMDLNSDELIERNELHAWILRSFKMLSEEESQDRFEDADENEDGKVTWKEYVSDAYGIQDEDSEDDNKDVSSEDTKLIHDDKIMFEAADRNKDGVLENSEFILFTHPEEHPEMLPLVLQQTLTDKDADQDGFISFQEFIGDQGKKHDKEWLIAEKEKFDHEYDKDGDGRLNGPEILSWIVPSNDEIAEEEVSHLFASSDDNEDGILSFQEILDHHQTFVGSEATDYGDHLHNIHVFQDEL